LWATAGHARRHGHDIPAAARPLCGGARDAAELDWADRDGTAPATRARRVLSGGIATGWPRRELRRDRSAARGLRGCRGALARLPGRGALRGSTPRLRLPPGPVARRRTTD